MDTEQKTPASDSQVDTIVILDCPFCGRKAKVYKDTLDGKNYYSVGCDNFPDCPGDGFQRLGDKDREKVITGWNTRA